MSRRLIVRISISIASVICAAALAGPAAVAWQGQGPPKRRVQDRLSLQQSADRCRRQLGKRFVESGEEKSEIEATLTLGPDRRQVHITRTQEEDGEHVEVRLTGGGKPATLLWTAANGVTEVSDTLTPELRAVAERIVLDSPDQFILAQLRGASYYTVAASARPSEAAGDDSYTGPVWQLVRVGEPQQGTQSNPLSPWRLYYINVATGLIDKVASQEGAETVMADLTGWADQTGEKAPSVITWRKGGQVIMELTFNSQSHGPK